MTIRSAAMPDAGSAPGAGRNVAVLAAAQALGGAAAPIAFATVPLAAYDMLGADKSFATLPVTAFVVGAAVGAVPAALLMRRVGRRWGLIAGMLIGAAGGAIDLAAVAAASFALLTLGTALIGFASAFIQQLRFAAADATDEAGQPRAISFVLAGGIAAAIIGPQAVVQFADALAGVPFGGAYLSAALLSLAAALVLLRLDIPRPAATRGAATGRPLGAIVRKADFLVAVGCATSAYALMSFVMTAAPLAMVLHHHSREHAALGIQWHVLAMYGPSFVTGSLIARFGAERIVAIGLLLLVGCAIVALAGADVLHFWAALVLLGIGWNFGFIGGTALVTRTYAPEEKEKVQALNDVLVFGFVALASFSSGEILLHASWNAVNIVVLPVAALCLATLAWSGRRRPAPGLS